MNASSMDPTSLEDPFNRSTKINNTKPFKQSPNQYGDLFEAGKSHVTQHNLGSYPPTDWGGI